MVNFPTSLDTLTNPTSTTMTNDPGFELDVVISTLNDIAEALEAKVGTGASTPTTAGDVAYVTGSGASAWGPRAPVRLAETTLGAGAASVTLSSIPQTYRHLMLTASARSDNAATGLTSLGLRFNADSGANYSYQINVSASTTVSTFGSVSATALDIGGTSQASSTANNFALNDMLILDYTNTAIFKHAGGSSGGIEGALANMKAFFATGVWASTAAITSITILPGAGSFVANSRFTLYGLPA